jgi:Ca2+-binding RTX toxin-like protein
VKTIVAALLALTLVPSASAAVIEGTNGPDNLKGTQQADVIRAKKGNDDLFGMRGADRLKPGNGRDFVNAGLGRDWIFAIDSRRDVIFCGDGFDSVFADRRDELNDCERVEFGGIG